MSRKMWFGPRGAMRPIKAMQSGGSHSPVGYTESSQYLSGRKGVRRSMGSHMEYDLVWRGMRDEVQHLIDCASGVFGKGPFYFLDPMWSETNCLAAHWASPILGTMDAPLIYGYSRPKSVPTPQNSLDLPPEGASFVHSMEAASRSHYIPIPPGRDFHFGYAGDPGCVKLAPMIGAQQAGADVTPQPALTTAPSLFTTVVQGSNVVDGVEVRIEPIANVTNYAPAVVQGNAWREVRRNLIVDPLFTVPSSLTAVRSTVTAAAGVLSVARTQAGGASRAQLILPVTAAVGEPVTFSAIRTMPAATSGVSYLMLEWFNAALSTSYGSATSQIDLVTLGEQLHEVVLARPHADATQLAVRFEAGSGLGNVVEWRKPLVEIGARPRAWYAPGVIEGIEQPGDFRARFAGTEHNSPMVLEGQAVEGYSGTRVAVVYSQKAGKPAIRLCPTGTDVANSFGFFTVPSALRTGGIALATRHLDAPLTGVLDPRAGRLLAVTPDAASDQAPNTAGSCDLRVDYGPLTSAYQVRLYHGGLAGSGDVWWTAPGLMEASYMGPPVEPGVHQPPARIYAMQAQVLPRSKSPKSGPFRGGRGHVGVQFEQHPTVTPYSAPYDSVGVTARLIEVDE